MLWRDRLLDVLFGRFVASASFRGRAAANPLLRPVARASAGQLFDLCAGFVYTQTLLACVRLDIPRLVDERVRTPAELARAFAMPVGNMEMLLKAAAALGIVRQRADGTFGLGRQGAALRDNAALVAMIEHNALLYTDIADPVAFLRRDAPEGALAEFWTYGAGTATDPSDVRAAAYSQLMAASQTMIAEQVLHAFSFQGTRRLLDVGGGIGAFAGAAVAQWPHLEAVVFDLPTVVAGAAPIARVSFRAGNFLEDPLPTGADVISIVRVLHDHDDAVVLRLLMAAAQALEAGGTIVIAEPMRGPGVEARMADAYFGFYLRAMGRGRTRSPAEIAALLQRAGFDEVQRISTQLPLVASLVIGKRTSKRQK